MDGTVLTIFVGGILLCAVPVALVVDAAMCKHLRLKREQAKADFEARQAKARAELAQATKHVAPAAATGGLTKAEVDRMIEILKKPTAREPETPPVEIDQSLVPVPLQPERKRVLTAHRVKGDGRPNDAPRRSPPPPAPAHTWPVRQPVTHGSQPSVADRGDTPLTPWGNDPLPPPPPAPTYDSGVTESGSWSDSSSSSSYDSSSSSSCDSGSSASGSWD